MTSFLNEWGPDIVVAGGTATVAFSGGALTKTKGWYERLKKPSWQPPNWLFGPAWSLILILTAISAVFCWYGTPDAQAAALMIVLFITNGILNVAWSLFFFHWHRPDWALLEIIPLWLSIASLIAVVAFYAGHACLLLLPYILWVSFAAYLNLTIVRLNAPFKAA